MSDHAYHHGNLRSVLLAEAERTLRDDGIDRLSLRELARRAGVSSAAPRRHFPDRQALLDALAGVGFDRLAEEIGAATDRAGDDYPARLRAAAIAYIRFATRDGALVDLMFAAKTRAGHSVPAEGPARLFATAGELIAEGQRTGALPSGDPDRLRLLLIATLQGVATLITSGRVPAELADTLAADAVTLFLREHR
ncbi:TetR/AcrR family transcriptional regulator [Nocardia sp. CA2R105]|uniref:TetR/AcrR family transcriptional regulator n=1 Tax=Nocardia coffeae TaxID=2873381 RepID=UPI001CA6CC87|nr:TetR/AcrR family transcriptional regulator [Nocardia coffeae]MBY8859582.1 TetR/AcrR family transcriptional regulator [Nocardia coffeae]